MSTTLQTILTAALRYIKRAVTLGFKGFNGHTAEVRLRQTSVVPVCGFTVTARGVKFIMQDDQEFE
jgi:hypothetical protein